MFAIFTAVLVRENNEDGNYVFQIGGDLMWGIDYTDDRKLKEKQGHCEVAQRLMPARK